MPEKKLRAFVKAQFDKGHDILKKLGKPLSPCYLLDKEMLASRARQFREAFEAHLPDTGFYFAVKSNNCPDISVGVMEQGFGLDVSSGVELAMALDMDAQDIVFSGPGKNNDELALAVSHHDRVAVLIDSQGELTRLAKIAARKGKSIRAGVRLNADPQGLWRKFGIPLQDLGAFIAKARTYDAIVFQGLQFHTSWNMGPERQTAFIRELGDCLATLSKEDLSLISFIDIGGGYWPEAGEWLHGSSTDPGRVKTALGMETPDPHHYENPAESIDHFAEHLALAIRTHIHPLVPCKICFEPGRWVCHDAMHLLVTVMDKKYDDLVITDGATNMIGWERFETDYFPVLNLTRPELTEKPCMILGSLCTPHDVWGYSYWGEDIREGDLLMLPTQGAYTYSLRQNFIKAVPDVIIYP